MFTQIEVIDVCPVGDNHAVPVQSFLEPFSQILVAGMHGLAVDGAGVDHDGQQTGLDHRLEGSEALLAHFTFGHIDRRTVLTGSRRTITQIVLAAGSNVEGIHTVAVVALESTDGSTTHNGIDQCVLTEVLPDTRPAGIAAQVDCRAERPGAVGSTRLIARDTSGLLGQRSVERGTHIDVLREERSTLCIGCAVIHVQTIETGDANLLHRHLLNTADHLLPTLG